MSTKSTILVVDDEVRSVEALTRMLEDDFDVLSATSAAAEALLEKEWVQVILNYQIIAPTTWNFSPRDAAGTPGALEQALVGTPVSTVTTSSAAMQHVVRSVDPCMVCTVH